MLQAQAEVGGTAYVLDRIYVYGLEYVDEQVCQIEPEGMYDGSDMYMFVLQDANYNVVSLITPVGWHAHACVSMAFVIVGNMATQAWLWHGVNVGWHSNVRAN